ncbi:ssDNA-binding protein [Bradyrhizobium oligotrophicum S58]
MAEVKHDTKRSDTRLLGEVRIAHPHHHEKNTKTPGGILYKTPHFEAVLLMPKLGPAETCPNYKILSDMAMEAAIKAWGSWPEGGRWPVEDGDIPYKYKTKPGEKALTPEQITERNKWRTGSWVVEVTNYTDQGPKVSILDNGVMQDIPARVMNGIEVYKSGDYGYASANTYTYQRDSNWGVNFSYEGVAYTRQGELIGGGPKSSANMFAGIPVGAGMGAAAPMPPGGVPRPPGAVPMPPAAPSAPAAPALPPLPPVAGPPLAPAAPVAPPLPPGVSAPGAAPMPPIPGR